MKAILAEPYTGVEPITDSLRPVLIRRMGMLWLPEVELLLLYQLSYLSELTPRAGLEPATHRLQVTDDRRPILIMELSKVRADM